MQYSTDGSFTTSCECNNRVVSADSGCNYRNDMSRLVVFFWLASAAWGAAVAHHVTAATVTGSVASRWFSPGDAISVRGAFVRATRGSFG